MEDRRQKVGRCRRGEETINSEVKVDALTRWGYVLYLFVFRIYTDTIYRVVV